VGLNDFHTVLAVIEAARPDEIYNLAGQSSVGLSFEQPVETLDSTIRGPLNILESLRLLKRPARLYNAGSSECFGNVDDGAADENTPFRPRSPYGVGKSAAFWTVSNYRESYGLYACSGILFNHESPLRPRRFVTRKIIAGATDIAQGRAETLRLGDIEIARDFGWAPEYVVAMWMMLQKDCPSDYVIATGETATLRTFVDYAFAFFGLDWRRHVIFDENLRRPADIRRSAGCPEKARADLGWKARTKTQALVKRLCESELACQASLGKRS
jgi:GDPmannose 4,6-dehydratase